MKYYTVKEAIDLAKETSVTKFDSTIEVHMKTGLDPRQADQQIRDVVVLPNGLGKTVRVLVFCQGEGVAKAQEGGADYIADSDEWIQKIQQGFADFDVAIATPDMMAKAGRLGRVLGPRGLMPNPKAGTVTMEIGKAVADVKAGKIDFKVDKYGIIHTGIGKVNFSADKLVDNAREMMATITKLKPTAAKGTYIKSIYISSTMSPGVQVDVKSVTI